MFFDMFLSATPFPPPAYPCWISRFFRVSLPLCSLLLSPSQAGGSDATIRKGKSHQLHARKLCPISSPRPYWSFRFPKQCFLLISAPALETLGHPGNVSYRAVKGSKVSCFPLPPIPGQSVGLGSGHEAFIEGKYS